MLQVARFFGRQESPFVYDRPLIKLLNGLQQTPAQTPATTVSGVLHKLDPDLVEGVNFTVEPPQPNGRGGLRHKHLLFVPDFAKRFSDAIRDMNKAGIIPEITSAYRTAQDQLDMQSGASGSNPAGAVSFHQTGYAVDIATMKGDFQKIRKIMRTHGFDWGGNFRKKDPPHFEINVFGTKGTAAYSKNLRARVAATTKWYQANP